MGRKRSGKEKNGEGEKVKGILRKRKREKCGDMEEGYKEGEYVKKKKREEK